MLGGQHGWADAEDGEDGEQEQEDWVVAAGPWTRKGGISASPPHVSRQASKQHAEEVWNTLHTEDGMELLEEQGALLDDYLIPTPRVDQRGRPTPDI
jgi:hypothetical protein